MICCEALSLYNCLSGENTRLTDLTTVATSCKEWIPVSWSSWSCTVCVCVCARARARACAYVRERQRQIDAFHELWWYIRAQPSACSGMPISPHANCCTIQCLILTSCDRRENSPLSITSVGICSIVHTTHTHANETIGYIILLLIGLVTRKWWEIDGC